MYIKIDTNISDFGNIIVGFLLLMGCLMVVGIHVGKYVLRALGTYAIAKRRGLRRAWLSWMPIGQDWMLGCVADQYQYVAKGSIKNRRKVMVVCSVATFVLGMFILGLYASILVQLAMNVAMLDTLTSQQLAQMFVGEFAVIASLVGIFDVVSIVLAVFQYIAVYNLYVSCDPHRGVLYLVLSILFPILMPVFIFVNGKKDLGMPPRKDAVTEAPETVQEPSEQE